MEVIMWVMNSKGCGRKMWNVLVYAVSQHFFGGTEDNSENP